MDFLAHTNPDGGRHGLEEHLHAVRDLAGRFAAPFGAADWAALAGLWHDLGKYRAGFQRYIRQTNDPDAHIEGKVGGREKTHSAAGAMWAMDHLAKTQGKAGEVRARVLAYLIAGHHAGLDDWFGGLKERLSGADAQAEIRETLDACPATTVLHPDGTLPDLGVIPRDTVIGIPGAFALWVRMLFSALVDADFLDTESFMNVGKTESRSGFVGIAELERRFEVFMQTKLASVESRGEADTQVNLLRADVLRQCRAKATCAPGVFTLTVPTGGGKTLASLAFALRHAALHGKRRIVCAIPYTSIIEQTADIYRSVFGAIDVVEHHSNAESNPSEETHRSRLATENWDAPLVVTTNVQLFESLFARRTSRCRKLHNLVNSVIVLDEAQLLPVEFLQPIVDIMRLLVRNYGVTVLMTTATQPALAQRESFDPKRGLRGFEPAEATEIIDDVPALYKGLRRVRVHKPVDLIAKRGWPEIAGELTAHPAVLAIVNRRADARELYRLLYAQCGTGVWHLSALMCARHRSIAIAAIKRDLEQRRLAEASGVEGIPVRVVSTQLVEAGVDMDFPVVYRAMAGLDSIAQAAGRCNREGRLDGLGEVHVFVPPTLPPPGLLRHAEQTCRLVWSTSQEGVDPLDPALTAAYFTKLYADAQLDTKGICEMLRAGKDADVRFREAAEAFRLIDDQDGATVLVRFRATEDDQEIESLIGLLERDGPERWLMRKLQRYGVTVYRRDLERMLRIGDVRPVINCPGLYVQAVEGSTLYDPKLGLNVDGAPGDPAGLIW